MPLGFRDPKISDQNIDQTICAGGYSKTVRPAVSVTTPFKEQISAIYGLKDPLEDYEGDHLIPIEDGGCPGPKECGDNFVKNFFDQPYCTNGGGCTANDPRGYNDNQMGAHQKDLVENFIHKELCSHKISLERVSYYLPLHWTECFNLMKENHYCL